MKTSAKRSAAVLLTGVLCAGLLAGCGTKQEEEQEAVLDGTQIVATVDGIEIPMGVLSLTARQQQAQMEALYSMYLGSSDIWDSEASDESGETVGQQQVRSILTALEQMAVMQKKAAEYEVTLSEEDEEAIQAAAAQFITDNTEDTLAVLAVDEEQTAQFLELQTYYARMYDVVLAEAEVEISDEEATQSTFTYVRVSAASEDLTDEEKEEKKENAQAILDAMLEDPEQDLEEVVSGIDDTLTVSSGHFTADENQANSTSYAEAVLTALRGVEDGEYVPEVIEDSDVYYVLRLDSAEDEDATETQRASLESTQRSEYFTETLNTWMEEAEIEEFDDLIAAITITNSHKFNIVYPETTETESAVSETEEAVSETESAVSESEEAVSETGSAVEDAETDGAVGE